MCLCIDADICTVFGITGSISRNCGTCGTNLFPYPLSTGEDCGDPLYSPLATTAKMDKPYFEFVQIKNLLDCMQGSDHIIIF